MSLPPSFSSLKKPLMPLWYKKKKNSLATFRKKKQLFVPAKIHFLETQEGVYFSFTPFIPSPPFIIVSTRHMSSFLLYTYFLIFAKIKGKDFRYGVYFRCHNNILELKWTLYTNPDIPLGIRIKLGQDIKVSQILIGGQNFNFFLSWEECKTKPFHITLFWGEKNSWSFSFVMEPLHLI